MRKRIDKKFLTILLSCACLAGTMTGCKSETPVVRPQDVELLEPVGVGESYEAAARRNLYNANIYSGSICPYIEEYSLENGMSFDYYATLPGDTVKKGQVLLRTNTENADKQIEELEKRIEQNEKDFREYLKEANEYFYEVKGDEEFWGQAVENWSQEEPAADSPEYAKWASDNMYYESRYRNALISRQKQEEAIRQRTELYQLEKDYNQVLLQRMKESRDKSTVLSEMNGVLVNVQLMSQGNYINADYPMAAVIDPDRKEIRCDYILKEDINKAERVYAIINGVEYDVEYIPSEDEKKSYTSFKLPEGSEAQLGSLATIVVMKQSGENVLTVPKDSVIREENDYFVYCLVDGERVYTPVKTGMQDGAYVEIVSGLQEGDHVLTSKNASTYKSTMTLQKGSVGHEFSQQGYLAYPRQEWISNPITYGTAYFGELMVNLNQPVKKGDVLFTIRVKPDELELARNEQKLQRERERLAKLQKEDPEKNKKEIEQRQETIAELEKLLGEMKADFATTEVRAPYDGIVTDMSMDLWRNTLENGSLLSHGQNLIVLSRQDSNYIIVEDTNGVLTYGHKAEVTYKTSEGVSKVTQGDVVTMSKNCISEELFGDGYALIRVSAEDAAEMAGSTANADGWWNRSLFGVKVCTRRMDNVVLVPRKAVVMINGVSYVKLKQKDGSVLYQSFVAGGADNENYWVAEGLTEGMEVCIE